MTKSRCKHWQGLSNSEAQTRGQSHLWVVDFICPPKFHRNFNCTKGIKFLLDIQHMDGNWNVQLSTTWKNYHDNALIFTRRCSVWSIHGVFWFRTAQFAPHDFIENSGKCPLFLESTTGFSKSPCNIIHWHQHRHIDGFFATDLA